MLVDDEFNVLVAFERRLRRYIPDLGYDMDTLIGEIDKKVKRSEDFFHNSGRTAQDSSSQ
ncbi:MAG: hypothetical protein ACP5SH_04125 [Syntrophobacteraceae bacterium]